MLKVKGIIRPLLYCFSFLLFSLSAIAQDKTARLFGRVFDAVGEPIANADIRLICYKSCGTNKTGSQPVQRTETDNQGNYKYKNISAGHHLLSVEAAGFVRAESPSIYLAMGQNQVHDIWLAAGDNTGELWIEVMGIVKDKHRTLEDTTLSVTSAFDSHLVKQIRTDKDGRYKVTLSSTAQYVITALRPGYEASAITVTPKIPAISNPRKVTKDFFLIPLSLP